MSVNINLVQSDPALLYTPHVMEEVQSGRIDLRTYALLLLKDLATAPYPPARALCLVDEGNIALARRFLQDSNLDVVLVEGFEERCRQVQEATQILASQLETKLIECQPSLAPADLARCLDLQEDWRQAIQHERYHLAQRDLEIAQNLFANIEHRTALPVPEVPSAPAVPPLALVQETIALADSMPERETSAAQSGKLLDQALAVWGEITESFSIPLRAVLKPTERPLQPFSLYDVRTELEQAQRTNQLDRERAENALKRYFYLNEIERGQVRKFFFLGLVACGTERLKDLIAYKDFETAHHIYNDLMELLKTTADVSYPDAIVYNFYRNGVEVWAALEARNRATTFEDYEKALSDQLLKLPRSPARSRLDSLTRIGSVFFFYYRVQFYENDYPELIQFYEEHHAASDISATGDLELYRLLEIAKKTYKDVLYRRAEIELTEPQFPPTITLAETLQHLKVLPPYQIASALKKVGRMIGRDSAAQTAPLMNLYDLLQILFDTSRAEELVFTRERIFALSNALRSVQHGANGSLVVGTKGESMPVQVLDHLERFVNESIEAVSTIDLTGARQHIANALEAVHEQRKFLREAHPAVLNLWHMLGDHWISILVALQRAMSRQTWLAVSLQSEDIIADQESPVVVYVRNDGPSTAQQIEVALVSSDLRIEPPIRREHLLAVGDRIALTFLVKPRQIGPQFELRLLLRYLDSQNNPIISSQSHTIVPRRLAEKRFPKNSPYVWGQPLGRDSRVFLGREDVFEFIRTRFWGEERNKIIALQGERRMGKTSILNQLGPRKIFGNFRVVMFDFQGRYANLNSMSEFLYAFTRHVRSEAHLLLDSQLEKTDFLKATVGGEHYDLFEQWLDQVEKELERLDTQVVILFDEFEKILSRRFTDSPAADARFVDELLQYLRNIMLKRTRFNWIIAGSWNLVAKQREYFSSLFGMALTYWISCLQQEDAIALIVQPVAEYLTYDQDAIERILRLTGGHPFYIQILCDELFSRAQKFNSHRVDVNDVNAVIKETLAQVTETSFGMMWASLSQASARVVLSAVANVENPVEFLPKKSILSDLRRKGSTIDQERFFMFLDPEKGELVRRGLVEVHPHDADRVRVQNELLYDWLQKTKRLEAVLKEER